MAALASPLRAGTFAVVPPRTRATTVKCTIRAPLVRVSMAAHASQMATATFAVVLSSTQVCVCFFGLNFLTRLRSSEAS